MSTIDYQRRRLASRVTSDSSGKVTIYCDYDTVSSLPLSFANEEGMVCVGDAKCIVNLLTENEADKFANTAFCPHLFYETEILVHSKNPIRQYLGYDQRDRVYIDIPVEYMWQTAECRRLAVSMELWNFVEGSGVFSEVYLFRSSQVAMVVLDCVKNDSKASTIHLWFASLVTKIRVASMTSERCFQLSTLMVNCRAGDLQVQQLLQTESDAPIMACVISELPDLPVVTSEVSAQPFKTEKILCQMGFLLEDISEAEMESGMPLCWLALTSEGYVILTSDSVGKDLMLASLINRYRKWHQVNLVCSPSKSFEVFLELQRSRLRKLTSSHRRSSSQPRLVGSPVHMRCSPSVTLRVSEAEVHMLALNVMVKIILRRHQRWISDILRGWREQFDLSQQQAVHDSLYVVPDLRGAAQGRVLFSRAGTNADLSCDSDVVWDALFLDKDSIWRPAKLIEAVNQLEVKLKFRCGTKLKPTSRMVHFVETWIDTRASEQQISDLSNRPAWISALEIISASSIHKAPRKEKRVKKNPKREVAADAKKGFRPSLLEDMDDTHGAVVVGFLRHAFKLSCKYYYVLQLAEHAGHVIRHVERGSLTAERVESIISEFVDWHVEFTHCTPLGFVEQGDDDFEDDNDDDDVHHLSSDEQNDMQQAEVIRQCYAIARSLGIRWTVCRPPTFWTEEQQRSFVNHRELPAELPPAPPGIRQLIDKRILCYECLIDSAALASMSNFERKMSYFAKEAIIVGENDMSEDEVPMLDVEFSDGSISVILGACIFKTIDEIADAFEADKLTANIKGIIDVPEKVVKACRGRNLKRQTKEQWMPESVSPIKDASDEWFRALQQMDDADGRDFFEEALITSNKCTLPNVHDSNAESDSKSDLTEEELIAIGQKDPRPNLSERLIMKGFERCPNYSCLNVLSSAEKICGKCRCKKKAFCSCSFCGAPYDVNRQSVCGSCEKYLPHSDLYQKQEELLCMQTRGSDAKSTSVLTATKLQEHSSNAVLMKVLHDQRSMISAENSLVQTVHEMKELMMSHTTSASSNDTTAMPPIPGLTCPLLAESIEHISKCEYGSLGEGFSVWSCIPYDGPWNADLYYNRALHKNALSSNGKAKFTSKDALMQIKQYVTPSVFERTIENYALIRECYGSTAYGLEIREASKIMLAYHFSRSMYLNEREKKASLAHFLDIIDFTAQRQTSMIKEIVRVSKSHDAISAVQQLRNLFPEKDWTVGNFRDIPTFEVRHLCSKHQDKLTAENWPRKEYSCACEWTVAVERRLAMNEKSTCVFVRKSSVDMYSIAKKAVGDVSKDPKGGQAEESTSGNPAGGKNDKITNSETDAYDFPRRSKLWNRQWFNDVKIQFNQLLREKSVANPGEYCLKSVTCKGVLQDNKSCQNRLCTRKHKLPSRVKRSLTDADFVGKEKLLLFCTVLWGGPIHSPNGSMSVNELTTKAQTMIDVIVEADEETEDEPIPEPDFSGPDVAPMAGANARRSDPAQTSVPISQSSDGDGSLRNAPPRRGVAEDNRVEFVDGPAPSLIPDGLATISKRRSSASIQRIGDVRVIDQWDCDACFQGNDPAHQVSLHFTVLDCGESFAGQIRKCEPISTAAAFRVSVDTIVQSMENDANTWVKHYSHGFGRRNGPPIWEMISTSMLEQGIAEDIRSLESDVVHCTLQRGQPIIPYWSAIMLPKVATNVAELKIFVDSKGQLSVQLLVPAVLFDDFDNDDDWIPPDVPVVCKYYSLTHAHAATMNKIVVGGQPFVFSEDLRSCSSESWRGLRLRQLLKWRSLFMQFFSFRVVLARQMDQVLLREFTDAPLYVEQHGFSEQFGGDIQNSDDNSNADIKRWDKNVTDDNVEGVISEETEGRDPLFYHRGEMSSIKNCKLPKRKFNSLIETERGIISAVLYVSSLQPFLLSKEDSRTAVGSIEEHTESKEENIKMVKRSDKEQTNLKEASRHAERFDWNEQEQVKIPVNVSSGQALALLMRAVKAFIQHEDEAYNAVQSKEDPGAGWMNQHGLIMADLVKWTSVVYAHADPAHHICRLEQILRESQHMGRIGPHLQANVVDEFFSDLPKKLKDELHDMMTTGAKTGLHVRDSPTKTATPSRTAVTHKEKVWKQLRKFAALGYVRCFPPSVRHILNKWNLILSPLHYVPDSKWKKQDRVVLNASKPTDGQELGSDVNSLSFDFNYEDVQADYIDWVVDDLIQHLTKQGRFTKEELIQIEADIKAAFKCVVLSIESMGSMCTEFDDWIIVYGRTAFGWKWATHTWSIFSKAIRWKVRSFDRNGWGKRLLNKDWSRVVWRMKLYNQVTCEEQLQMLSKWRMNLTSMYVDDLHSLIGKDLTKARKLADNIRTTGFLLLGHTAWSLSKANEEGFFAWLHKYTGVVINTELSDEPRLGFTKDRILKCLEIVNEALEDTDNDEFSVNFFQSGFGNLIWLAKVYRCIRAHAAAYRRPLRGVSTNADADMMISVKNDKESKQQGARKFKLCNLTLKTMLTHILKVKDMYGENSLQATVPMSTVRDIDIWSDVDSMCDIGSIGGDASGSCWCIMDHRLREMMIITIPEVLSAAIRQKQTVSKEDVRAHFMISIAEHLVLVFAMLQWSHRWRHLGINSLRYNTDNANSYWWTKKGFAGCEVAQALCRFICVMEMVYGITVWPAWVASLVNKMGDDGSRVYRHDGSINQQALESLYTTNNALMCPYKMVKPAIGIFQLIGLLETISSPFELNEALEIKIEDTVTTFVTFGDQDLLNAAEKQRHSSGDAKQSVGASTTDSLNVFSLPFDCNVAKYQHSGGAARIDSVSVREELMNFRESWTVNDVKQWCRSESAAYSVGFIGPGGNIATAGVTRAGGKPKFGSEIDPIGVRLFEEISNTMCLGDIFDLDWSQIPDALVWLITLDCVDFARSGKRLGKHGPTGWRYTKVIDAVLHCMPLVVVHEMSDYTEYVNNGDEVNEVVSKLSSKYVVYKRILRMVDYGDAVHRSRLVITAFRKDFDGAWSFEVPEPIYDANRCFCARDIADKDDDVPDDDWRYEPLTVVYDVKKPVFGELQRLGRIRSGYQMGPGSNPYSVLGWDGTKNGPTIHGGGGSFPSLNWKPGETITARRVTTMKEYYRQASVSETFLDWHMSVTCGDKAQCRRLVNNGFFAGTVCTLFTAIFSHMRSWGVQTDMPMVKPDAGKKYITGPWLTGMSAAKGGKTGISSPSEAQRVAWMKELPHDWSKPLYPSRPGFRHHLSDPITAAEWAQIEYGYQYTDKMQIVGGTEAAYNRQQLKAAEFVMRYDIEGIFGSDHAQTGIIFDPAVWLPHETQKVLCDLAMHDAYVRGNSWSTVRQLMYAVRHCNVKNHGIDILKGKARLWQLLDGLKKCKGPKKGKHPVTRAMLLHMEKFLKYSTDEDELRMWAAVLTAFHFMMRSCEYTARLANGKFDLDYVIRVCDIKFKLKGKLLQNNFRSADELLIIFGRSKTSEGGEARSQFRCKDSKLCVVAIMAELFERIDMKDQQRPVFAWKRGSKRSGQGVRYYDVMKLLKGAAEACGRSSAEYGTHSLRRGGATAYLLAGASVESLTLYGRWKSMSSARRYMEPAAGQILKGFQDKVNEGFEEPHLILQQAPREREVQMFRAQQWIRSNLDGI